MNYLIVRDYLRQLLTVPYPGLLVADNDALLERVVEAAAHYEFQETTNWRDALWILASGRSALLRIYSPICEQTFALISQCREGMPRLSIYDHNEKINREVDYDPMTAHLLLVTTKNWIGRIEKTVPLRDMVGLVERVTALG